MSSTSIQARFLSLVRRFTREQQEPSRDEKIETDPALEMLPYFSGLRGFERLGQILKREDIYGSGPPSPTVSQEMLGYIKKYASKRVLDIGCGIGAYTRALSQDGYECVGIEDNQTYVDDCRKSGLRVQCMNAHRLEFPTESFDTVIMVEVLEHLSNPILALQEAFRVAKQNVMLSVPNIDVIPIMSKYQVVPWHLLEATHINFFTPKILELTLKKFTVNTEVFTYGHFAPWITEQQMHMHICGIGWKR
jgi:2-polyprenyl-3-methyl-5-hydroxy-6-metoxy-1,4-benzoquinol methylase